jgi:hypothetical protein
VQPPAFNAALYPSQEVNPLGSSSSQKVPEYISLPEQLQHSFRHDASITVISARNRNRLRKEGLIDIAKQN